MSVRIHFSVASVVLSAGIALTLAAAVPARAASSGPRAGMQKPNGEAVFRRACAACHLGLADMGAMAGVNPYAGAGLGHALPREMLHSYPPEAILNALTKGKMQAQGAALTIAERRAVAEFASGRALGAKPLDPSLEDGKACAAPAPRFDPEQGARWNGWGNGIANTRFQARELGGLTAADLPHLKVAWVFGFANVASVRSQPAVAGGRIFVASENGRVHALDARTGCTYWTFAAEAGVGTALSVGRYRDRAGASRYAVYFGDRRANAYAVDAETGRGIWTRKVDAHPAASITGSPTVYRGRVFVPVQGIGEEGRAARGEYACCTFRGSVSALDASTGALLWKTYTVPESRPRARNKDGVQMYGPAGGGIWSAPTIDARRGLVYIATGNGYSEPAQPTTDAIIALDIRTGAVRWVRQALADDIWVMGCDKRNSGNPACPPELGPDYDFSASPALARIGSRELLVLPQKSGMAFALDPARDGRIVWRVRIGQGSGLGGQWGAAVEDGVAYIGVGDVLSQRPGGVWALKLTDGSRLWHQPPPTPLCAKHLGCSVGQAAALTTIPGAVLSGALDGGLRAYAAHDGSLLWTFDCDRDFDAVNGVHAHGGGIDGPGPIVAGGMLYTNCGNGGLVGLPGNVLVAFAPQGRTRPAK
ncbi:MAG TPA: PQQ-binding-like beta-propeller repeat protein [Steroidobacteraceae bacterium]|nr:PQQ-binding-like beta-propeller repeat protein [Steroidobacteraceae bacterium]